MTEVLKGVVKGIGHALCGFKGAFKEDRHFRINLFLSLTGTALSLVFLEGSLRLVVAFVNYMVLVVELLNTAVERAVDTATTEFKESAKLSKDASAAAVLSVGLFALALDLIFLLPKIVKELL
ncbi:diacylglycerol kinase [Thermovibrio sp.]